MNLFYRRPSIETREAMSKAALNLKHVPGGKYEEIGLAEEAIKDLTTHEHVKIVNSGNSAILAIMSMFKKRILVPDQGGWVGFKKMADLFGVETVKIPTNFGIIEIDELDTLIKKFDPEALFLTSFGGYTAEQPMADVFKICEDNGIYLVEDASGGIGDKSGKLGNGRHAHIIIASTGTPKTVNIGNGGFLSTNYSEILDSAKNVINSLKADPVTCAGIATEIQNAPYILENTIKACRILKSEINQFRDVLHPEKRGMNVIIPDLNAKNLGYKLRKSLNVQGGSMVTLCPNYNRVKLKAVCIEIKNLNINCLTSDNLDEIQYIIKNTH